MLKKNVLKRVGSAGRPIMNVDDTLKTRTYRMSNRHLEKLERISQRRKITVSEVMRRAVESYKG